MQAEETERSGGDRGRAEGGGTDIADGKVEMSGLPNGI